MSTLSRNLPSPTSLIPAIIIIIITSSLISLTNSNPNPPSNPINGSPSPDIHDILPYYNLPKGVIPNGVKSYTLSAINGSFNLEMENPCYVKFPDNQIVYYDKIIKGKLSYGKVSDVKGIQAKKFFIWVSVTGMEMDPDSGMVEFFVGALTQKLPAKMFEVIPTCMNKACSVSIGYLLNFI